MAKLELGEPSRPRSQTRVFDDEIWEMKSRAVVANGTGTGCVLWHVGGQIEYDISMCGSALDHLGLDDAPPGVSVWEGAWEDIGTAGEPDCQLVGEFREPTEGEWFAVRAGRCPWNAQAWSKSGRVALAQEHARDHFFLYRGGFDFASDYVSGALPDDVLKDFVEMQEHAAELYQAARTMHDALLAEMAASGE